MDHVERIEQAIVEGSAGFFEDADIPEDLRASATIREDLHVTIRIARDFYDFLVRHGESPGVEEIDYIMGTIASGIDEFFLLAYACRFIDTDRKTWNIDPHEHWDFRALRAKFIHAFEHLADPNTSAVDKLSALFALTHLELTFLARYFPSAIFSERVSDSKTIDESLQSIKKMIGGDASWT